MNNTDDCSGQLCFLSVELLPRSPDRHLHILHAIEELCQTGQPVRVNDISNRLAGRCSYLSVIYSLIVLILHRSVKRGLHKGWVLKNENESWEEGEIPALVSEP